MITVIILLISFIFLFFISYFFNGQDIFAPGTVLTLAFILATFCAIYQYPIWKYNLSLKTVFIFFSIVLITILINILFHNFHFTINSKHRRMNKKEDIKPLSIFYYFFAIVILLITIYFMRQRIFSIGGSGNITEVMSKFRISTAYSTDADNDTSGWLKILQYFSVAFAYISSFNLIWFWKKLPLRNKIIDIVVIFLSIVTGLLSGGRFGLATTLITFLMIQYLVKIKKEGKINKYKLKMMLKITIVVIIAFIVFYQIRTLVGRSDDETDILSYISHYLGGGIPIFDIFLKKGPKENVIFGQETFYPIIKLLKSSKIINIPDYLSKFDFVYSNGQSMGNVYTALRCYYNDFGYVGMYIIHIIESIIYCSIYERLKLQGKNMNNVSIIVYSSIYYCIIFYPVGELFFANIVGLGFVIKTIIIILLYELFLNRKIHFKISLK